MGLFRRPAGDRTGGQFASHNRPETDVAAMAPMELRPVPMLDPNDPHAGSRTFNWWKLDSSERSDIAAWAAGHDSVNPPLPRFGHELAIPAAIWFWSEGPGAPCDRELREYIGAKFLGDMAGPPAIEEYRARMLLLTRDLAALAPYDQPNVEWTVQNLIVTLTDEDRRPLMREDGQPMELNSFIEAVSPDLLEHLASGRSLKAANPAFPEPGGPSLADVAAVVQESEDRVVEETRRYAREVAQFVTGQHIPEY